MTLQNYNVICERTWSIKATKNSIRWVTKTINTSLHFGVRLPRLWACTAGLLSPVQFLLRVFLWVVRRRRVAGTVVFFLWDLYFSSHFLLSSTAKFSKGPSLSLCLFLPQRVSLPMLFPTVSAVKLLCILPLSRLSHSEMISPVSSKSSVSSPLFQRVT